MSDVSVLNLFPTPIAKLKLGILTQQFVRFAGPIKNEEHQSKNNYLLDGAAFLSLKKSILPHVSSFMKYVLCIDGEPFITQSWVNKNSIGNGHHKHHHPNSIVSGVVYLDVPAGASIVFHKNTGNNSYAMQPALLEPLNDYTKPYFELAVESGDLVLFPSYLWHSVPANLDKKDRWSLAFNCVTNEKIGSAARLNELKLKR